MVVNHTAVFLYAYAMLLPSDITTSWYSIAFIYVTSIMLHHTKGCRVYSYMHVCMGWSIDSCVMFVIELADNFHFVVMVPLIWFAWVTNSPSVMSYACHGGEILCFNDRLIAIICIIQLSHVNDYHFTHLMSTKWILLSVPAVAHLPFAFTTHLIRTMI